MTASAVKIRAHAQAGEREPLPPVIVLHNCGGKNEHGKQCGKLLFAVVGDRLEVRCRRCKTMTTVKLQDLGGRRISLDM